ncbi:MAG: glycosyl transferase [Paludibacter sp.]
MNDSLAPIVLFVYNRPFHTEQTLSALQQNDLARQSTLYIYCDGTKENTSVENTENIRAVRRIVKEVQGFKEVFIIESEQNKGLACSIQSGISEIIKKHGRVIVLEDDLITSPAFLSYMNKALVYYENRKSVFSISGYNMPSTLMQIPEDYEYDVYVSLRNDSWGWGTWDDRWNQVDWNVSSYPAMLKSKQLQEAFNRGGDDMFEMLQKQQSGKLNIWSIQFTLAHFMNHAVSIVPTVSYVDNVGLDGSGENCGLNPSLKNKTLCTNENIRFLDILYEDKRIINAFYSANCNKKRPLWQKMLNRLSRLLGRKNIFVIKKKIYD